MRVITAAIPATIILLTLYLLVSWFPAESADTGWAPVEGSAPELLAEPTGAVYVHRCVATRTIDAVPAGTLAWCR